MYNKGVKDDFVVTYLEPIDKNNCYQTKSPRVVVCHEKLGDVVSYYKCDAYLRLHFDDLVSDKNVARCCNILKIICKKVMEAEEMGDKEEHTDFYTYKYFKKNGTFKHSRKYLIHKFFCSVNPRIICYDIEKYWKGKENSSFTLRELIDEQKYKFFVDYWNSVPDYESVRKVLLKILSKDMVDKLSVTY